MTYTKVIVRIRIVASLLLLFMAALPGAGAAGTVDSTWIGGSGNWSNNNNWSPGQAPNNNRTSTYNVFIDGNAATNSYVNLNNNATINNLTVGQGDTLSFNQNKHLSIVSGSAVNNAGTLSFGNGSSLDFLSASGTLTSTGLITGTGTITGNVINSGTVNPGSSIGTLSITGNYTQTSLGRLFVDLAGTGAGQYDFLNISGNANLGGTLAMNLFNSFDPASGSSFNILQANSGLTGTFSNLSLPVLSGGRQWQVAYGANRVQVNVVPEPSAYLTFVAGIAIVLVRRRVKQSKSRRYPSL